MQEKKQLVMEALVEEKATTQILEKRKLIKEALVLMVIIIRMMDWEDVTIIGLKEDLVVVLRVIIVVVEQQPMIMIMIMILLLAVLERVVFQTINKVPVERAGIVIGGSQVRYVLMAEIPMTLPIQVRNTVAVAVVE